MTQPPAEWFTQREAEAVDYEKTSESGVAEEFRKETAEIAKAYTAGDPAAKLSIAVDLREPENFTEADLEALEAVKRDPAASARFENWSIMEAEDVIDPFARFLKSTS